ncbi:hypothetical protein MACH24_10430 [Erythrobacter sp. Dej080120_24]|uniref:helix-turn-helix domain-containing protein n=1 Tax=Erythrobacter sp. Dej080120_24 TaxID=3024837 RepID=UPI00291EBD6F|nr:hypothetical protein MACH24_10430 [Erythrobacter sp. Dej080120_24]
MDSEQDSTGEEPTDLMESEIASIGDRLRNAREAKRLDVAHIAAETRIPQRHLESIEAGKFDDLPSRTYAIGFAKTYARAVGMDPAEVAEAVREELADGHSRASALAGGMEPGDPAKLPSAGLAWFGAIAAIIFAVGLFFFYNTYFAAGTGPAPLIAEAEESPAPEQVPTQAGAAGDTATAASAAPTGGEVVFTATGEGAWVRFYEEGGERLFEGVMQEGDTYSVPADAQDPRLNTGRPNLLTITIGGKSVPPISEDMVPVADAPVSAAALLARTDDSANRASAN